MPLGDGQTTGGSQTGFINPNYQYYPQYYYNTGYHPKCDCHDCTQARKNERLGVYQQQGIGYQQLMFSGNS